MAAGQRDWKTAAAQFKDGGLAGAGKSAREGLAADAASRVPRLHLLPGETLSRLKRHGEAREQYTLYAKLAKDDPEAAQSLAGLK